MPANKYQKEFAAAFLKEIDKHKVSVTDSLQTILTAPLPAEVKILLFETFSDWRRIPIQVFAMNDKSPDEVYFKPPFSGALVPKSAPLVTKGSIDQDLYEEHDVDTFDTGHKLLAEWVGAIWTGLGGKRFQIPAFIGKHDTRQLFDLRQSKWITSKSVWG